MHGWRATSTTAENVGTRRVVSTAAPTWRSLIAAARMMMRCPRRCRASLVRNLSPCVCLSQEVPTQQWVGYNNSTTESPLSLSPSKVARLSLSAPRLLTMVSCGVLLLWVCVSFEERGCLREEAHNKQQTSKEASNPITKKHPINNIQTALPKIQDSRSHKLSLDCRRADTRTHLLRRSGVTHNMQSFR